MKRTPIRVGVFLGGNLPEGVATSSAISNLVSRATEIESLGFNSLFLGHHILSSSRFLQPLSLAAFLAAKTSNLRIGLGVYVLPLVNPLIFAEEVATINELADGRFIVGVGAGYRGREYQAVGMAFDERFKRLEEYVSVVSGLLRGEAVTVAGTFGQLRDARVNLADGVRKMPIWMGAFGNVGIRRCGRLGLPWLAGPEGSIDVLAERLREFRTAVEGARVPGPAEYPLLRELFVARTDEEAETISRPFLAAQYAEYKSWNHGLTVDDLIKSDAVVGSPETVALRLNSYRDLGFTDVVIRADWPGMDFHRSDESLRMLAREVFPLLK